MTCASCASSVESIVSHHKGVVNASVNFATGNLILEYLSDKADAAQLQKAVQSVGYDLLVEDETNQQETLEAIHAEKLRQMKNKNFCAILLSIPVVAIRSEEHTSELQSLMRISYAVVSVKIKLRTYITINMP